jgi:hypothetical protein
MERTAGSRAVIRFIALVAFGGCLAGCYTLQPVGTDRPLVGKDVAFDVNDAGRVALGGSMGPAIRQIEGRLVQEDSGQYLVSVSAVHFLYGGEQAWTGESVRLKSEFVGSSYERHFSPARTIALSAIGVAAAAALVGRSLLGAGNATQRTPPQDTGKTLRLPASFRIPLLRFRPPVRLIPILGRP